MRRSNRLPRPCAAVAAEVHAGFEGYLDSLEEARLSAPVEYRNQAGAPFMVLEFLQGRTLRRVMDWQSPFSPERAVNIMLQILGSVAEAHALGVVHRDLKPSNIMLFQPNPSIAYDQVKVLDFGLAKLTPSVSENFITNPGRLTEKGTTVGTPQYMPPEQMRGQMIVPASDLFSVGMLAYEMLVGRHPYRGSVGMDLAVKMAEPVPIRIPDEANVSAGLAEVIHRLLEKRVDDRYERAEQVMDDLEQMTEATVDMAGFFDGESSQPQWLSSPHGDSFVSLVPPTSPESEAQSTTGNGGDEAPPPPGTPKGNGGDKVTAELAPPSGRVAPEPVWRPTPLVLFLVGLLLLVLLSGWLVL